MNLESMLHDLFLKQADLPSLPLLLLSLGLSALHGFVLGEVYVRFGHALSNRRFFAKNFLLLTVTTTLVIGVIKSSLALSLGMVGALSIVRFRAAIKEPEELAFLFLSIAIGLGFGANQTLVTILATCLILGLFILHSLSRRSEPQPNLFVTVSSSGDAKLTAKAIQAALAQSGARSQLKRLEQQPGRFEASFLADFAKVEDLERFCAKLRSIDPTVRVRCLEDRGLQA